MNQTSLFYKLLYPILLTLVILIVGVLGFSWLENYNFLEAFYMTVITVATVGFSEVRPLSHEGRVFTSFLIIASFGTFAYTFASLSKYIVDGEIQNYFKLKKVNAAILKLNNHVIVCGYGRNGKQTVKQLINNNIDFVVIESNHDLCQTLNEEKILFIEGDATQDEILISAQINKAKAIITALPLDANNLFIVLSARSLNNSLEIISRASEDSSNKKLKMAGANHVIMPDKIGGAHMASLVIKPNIIEFMDFLSGNDAMASNLHEIAFEILPQHINGKKIRDLDITSKAGTSIIGFKALNQDYIINPVPDTYLSDYCKLFVLGDKEQIVKIKNLSF